jgi:hypothetical protein
VNPSSHGNTAPLLLSRYCCGANEGDRLFSKLLRIVLITQQKCMQSVSSSWHETTATWSASLLCIASWYWQFQLLQDMIQEHWFMVKVNYVWLWRFKQRSEQATAFRFVVVLLRGAINSLLYTVRTSKLNATKYSLHMFQYRANFGA